MRFLIGLLLLVNWSAPVFGKTKPFEKIETAKTSRELAEPGRFTIVEFYVDWCETCKAMPDHYKIWRKHKPDTAIKRVPLPRDFDFGSVSKRHGIQMCQVPHFEIFNPDGSLFLKDRCTDGQAFRYIFSTLKQMTASEDQKTQ